MTSCSPASVRSDGTSTCRRVGGTIRANDTVSRYIDSTTGTPHHRRSNTGDIIPRCLRVAHPSASIKVGPVAGGEAEGARGELVLFHQGGGVRLQELRIRGPMKSGAGGGQDHTTGRTPLAGVLLTSPPSRP